MKLTKFHQKVNKINFCSIKNKKQMGSDHMLLEQGSNLVFSTCIFQSTEKWKVVLEQQIHNSNLDLL